MRRPVAVFLALSLSFGAAIAIPALSSASAPPSRTASSSPPVKGIGILMNNANVVTDTQAMTIANSLFSTVATKLHANAVSFNFPYYETSSTSNSPIRAAMTPSPERLAALTAVARRYHLTVEYRPYLYEGNLAKNSRTTIRPTNPTLWISNYFNFLQPYLISANKAGATSFSVALELTSLLGDLSQWTQLVQKAKTLYSGQLFYSQSHFPMESIPLTARGYDAYQPITLASPSLVSVARFTSGFEKNFRLPGMQSSPADLTIEEIGLAAVSGAYNKPFFEHYPKTTKVNRVVQEDWYQGACNAFWALHLAGMYYWAIGFNGFSVSENNTKDLYAWFNTPTATVVANCYARTH